jgi:TolA-binding protein
MDQHVHALSTASQGCRASLSPLSNNYRSWVDAYRTEVQRNHRRRQENHYLHDQVRQMTAEIRSLRTSNAQLTEELDLMKQAQPSLERTSQLEILVKQYEAVS